MLGDYVSTGLGVIGLAWQSSPALTEVEEVVTDWMRQMLGLSEPWSGVINDTASTSTLVALICARERTHDYGLGARRPAGRSEPLVVYTSAHSHSSVEKAALLAGFGKSNVRIVPHDGSNAMRPESLEQMVQADSSNGRNAVRGRGDHRNDDVDGARSARAIARVAQSARLWLHVDAAMAGSAMILPECRWMWQGVEQADSLIVNPHKWLGAVFDCSIYFVRDPEHLVRVMSTNPSYLQSGADGRVKNYRDWGLPLGRRFRALKLWFLIREQGVEGLQARLRRDLENARWLADQIAQTPGLARLGAGAVANGVRAARAGGNRRRRARHHTLAWAARLNQSGEAYVTPALLDGRWMVRISIGAEQTERAHVQELWQLLQDAVRAS